VELTKKRRFFFITAFQFAPPIRPAAGSASSTFSLSSEFDEEDF
jgi:hypothetical protein